MNISLKMASARIYGNCSLITLCYFRSDLSYASNYINFQVYIDSYGAISCVPRINAVVQSVSTLWAVHMLPAICRDLVNAVCPSTYLRCVRLIYALCDPSTLCATYLSLCDPSIWLCADYGTLCAYYLQASQMRPMYEVKVRRRDLRFVRTHLRLRATHLRFGATHLRLLRPMLTLLWCHLQLLRLHYVYTYMLMLGIYSLSCYYLYAGGFLRVLRLSCASNLWPSCCDLR